MTSKIVVLSPKYSEDSIRLLQASYQSSYQLRRFGSWTVPEEFRKDVVAVYGEDLFAQVVAEQCGFTLLKPEENWLTTLPFSFVKRKLEYGKLSEFTDRKNVFIKPADFKFFAAGVYSSIEDIPGYAEADKNWTVLVSETVQWTYEVRCFILNRKLVTQSAYVYNGQLKEVKLENTLLEELENFIAELLQHKSVLIPEAVVIDVGIIRDKGWAVIEANPAWASGLYACEPLVQTLEVIVKSCTKS